MTARIEQVSSEEINAWIIGDDEEVIVIDPGRDPVGRARRGGRPRGARRDLHARSPGPRGRGAGGGRARRGAGGAAPAGPAGVAGPVPGGRRRDRDGRRRDLRGRRRPARGHPRPRPHARLGLPVLRGPRCRVHRARPDGRRPGAARRRVPRLRRPADRDRRVPADLARQHPRPAGPGRGNHDRGRREALRRVGRRRGPSGAAGFRGDAAAAVPVHADASCRLARLPPPVPDDLPGPPAAARRARPGRTTASVPASTTRWPAGGGCRWPNATVAAAGRLVDRGWIDEGFADETQSARHRERADRPGGGVRRRAGPGRRAGRGGTDRGHPHGHDRGLRADRPAGRPAC